MEIPLVAMPDGEWPQNHTLDKNNVANRIALAYAECAPMMLKYAKGVETTGLGSSMNQGPWAAQSDTKKWLYLLSGITLVL